ncbi:MAG: hypothetical protein OHK0053_36340 [Microscillaceae bacterium]
MWLIACSPEQELPQPQDPWVKVQQWYAQQNALNKHSSTYFHPQWGEGQLQTLADGSQLALFPVHREVAVQYYEVGFVRRLAVRLSPEGEVLEGRMIEMIGDKAYLAAHKDELARKHWEGEAIPWPTIVLQDTPWIIEKNQDCQVKTATLKKLDTGCWIYETNCETQTICDNGGDGGGGGAGGSGNGGGSGGGDGPGGGGLGGGDSGGSGGIRIPVFQSLDGPGNDVEDNTELILLPEFDYSNNQFSYPRFTVNTLRHFARNHGLNPDRVHFKTSDKY